MSEDQKARNWKSLSHYGLKGKFLNAALDYVDIKYPNKLQGQAFTLGCAFAYGYYKDRILNYQKLKKENAEWKAQAEKLAEAIRGFSYHKWWPQELQRALTDYQSWKEKQNEN